MPPPRLPESLSAIATTVQWYVQYSVIHFLPEVILTGGFLLVILLNALARNDIGQKATVYLSILVLVLAGFASALQWHGVDPGHPREWKSGAIIFPYTQTLFAPNVRNGEPVSGYGMAVADNFAVFFKLLIAVTGILVLCMSLASRELMARSRRLGDYSSLLLGMMVGLFLMPASTDLLMMYLSLELVSIAGYILAGFSKDTPHASEAALKYILFGALSSGLMLYGFSLFYGLTGTTQIIAIRQVLALSPATHTGSNLLILWLATALVLVGMCYKISAVPFHFWTPDVYEGAPAPVAALLSVASKAAGFGLLARFVIFTFPLGAEQNLPVINWPLLIAALSVITMTVGNLAALLQSNVRRLLAYSSIAHAGYILAALAVSGASIPARLFFSPPGVVAIMIYLATYLFMQLGAFYVIMLIENKIGSEEIDDYRGLGARSPIVASAFVIFLVSLTGIPLTAGFIGKFYLFTAILTPNPVTHGMPWLWLAIAAILNSIVSLYYYLRIASAMFLKRPLQELALQGVTDSGKWVVDNPDARYPLSTLRYPLLQRILLFAFVIPVIALGVYFQPLIDFASGVVRFFNF
ncbi:MAG: NADH-quinone oxidoreductase subunit N [Bacteroidota bacterium]|nr:NADH-quinone oxidoreductase subunit N [Bacteroidota bacterium]MDP4232942.1 NADH-quinone oxidoreductase subunit N [Bacteroidota bacterium]MDP4241986.1 NADH-quinone oxidoreductase subunit N [Bacteroidota bacterium]MDP4286889.1 NADH-quinone oxidoreductase subunit N [Bacteroidota bacterium]